MYGVDINFLSDREIRQVQPSQFQGGGQPPAGDRRPLFLGIGAAVAALAIVGGYFGYLKYEESRLNARQAELDEELSALQNQLQEVRIILAQTDLIVEENRAWVEVFEQIRPWSALLQDSRDRIPARAQITSIQQTPGLAVDVEGSEEPIPPENGGVQVLGTACSYDDVNDFFLTLQRSPFLDGETTQLVQASLGDEVDGRCPGEGAQSDTSVQLVEYTVSSNINNVPASELLQILEQKGTVGLVARIRALQQTGVVEP
ncbi:MAG: PilN domain-containing protein [Cyanobacteria bacterium P01_A01_bin.123]